MGVQVAVVVIAFAGMTMTPPARAQQGSLDENRMTMQLAMPKGDPHNAVVLLLTVGSLADGASVVVYGPQGEILGSASPFGAEAHRSGGTYMIPIPARLAAEALLSISAEVVEAGGKTRKPMATELLRAVVVRQDYPASSP